MITFKVQTDAVSARQYFASHLSSGDYQATDQWIVGQWLGEGANRLGLLSGTRVLPTQFDALCANLTPANGQPLTARTNRAGERRVFVDFVISAPKSVSILAVTVGDERLIAAHQGAAITAMQELERLAAARVRRAGKNRNDDRLTGNVVAAGFLHHTSRSLDPQLHSHHLAFNATFDLQENRWKALQPGAMTRAVTYGTEVYRNELVRGLITLGYLYEDEGKRGFRIRGVSRELCRRLSERSAQRDRAIEHFRHGHQGRAPTKDEISLIIHRTRPTKLTQISASQVIATQRAKLSPGEWAHLQSLPDVSEAKSHWSPSLASGDGATATETLQRVADGFLQRNSSVSEHQLLATALRCARGRARSVELRRALDDPKHFAKQGGRVTTLETLRAEACLVRFVNQRVARFNGWAEGFGSASNLRREHAIPLRAVLNSRNGVMGLRIPSADDMAAILRGLMQTARETGKNVRFCLPAFAAQRPGYGTLDYQPETIEDLLSHNPLPPFSATETFLVVDQADALGARQLERLFGWVQAGNHRVLLIAAAKSSDDPEASNSFELLERHSRLNVVTFIGNQQRQHAALRQSKKAMAAGDFDTGFKLLEDGGLIVESSGHQTRHDLVAGEYLAHLRALTKPRSSLVMASSWLEAAALTTVIRQRLRDAGRITGAEHHFQTWQPLAPVQARQRDFLPCQPGEILQFPRRAKGFSRGEVLEILDASGQKGAPLQVRRGDGTLIMLEATRVESCARWECRGLAVAVGDRLLLLGHHKERGKTLIRGQIVTASGFEPDGAITLTDGRSIPPTFRAWCHAYAVTLQAAQGQQVLDGWVCCPSPSLAQMSAEQFYAAVSRVRQTVRVHTDDLIALRAAATIPAREKAVSVRVRMNEQLETNSQFLGSGYEPFRPSSTTESDAVPTVLPAHNPTGPDLRPSTLKSLLPKAAWWQRPAQTDRWLALGLARAAEVKRKHLLPAAPRPGQEARILTQARTSATTGVLHARERLAEGTASAPHWPPYLTSPASHDSDPGLRQ